MKKNYGQIKGPIVMIGFGSIGKGTLPLIERHFKFNHDQLVVIDPSAADRKLLDDRGIKFLQIGLTDENYQQVLRPLLASNSGPGFCVNLSVDVCSLDVMKLCREIGAFYIDTVVEPWAGFYFDASKKAAARSN